MTKFLSLLLLSTPAFASHPYQVNGIDFNVMEIHSSHWNSSGAYPNNPRCEFIVTIKKWVSLGDSSLYNRQGKLATCNDITFDSLKKFLEPRLIGTHEKTILGFLDALTANEETWSDSDEHYKNQLTCVYLDERLEKDGSISQNCGSMGAFHSGFYTLELPRMEK